MLFMSRSGSMVNWPVAEHSAPSFTSQRVSRRSPTCQMSTIGLPIRGIISLLAATAFGIRSPMSRRSSASATCLKCYSNIQIYVFVTDEARQHRCRRRFYAPFQCTPLHLGLLEPTPLDRGFTRKRPPNCIGTKTCRVKPERV